ncbi:MAG: sulfur transferase domain-containing protein [Leptolyngbyaceae cyanobacterium bins.59]|nr:sulfur transferase domain-containing protein [Leptolyngbyaceae cyanobacterium bins.59]
METIRKINEELSIAGQIDDEQLLWLSQEGYRSLLNLRSSQEEGFWVDEQSKAECLGFRYLNLPIHPDVIDDVTALRVLQQINTLPKPMLVHCDSAVRAAAIALMHITTRQGTPLDRAFKQVRQLGLFDVFVQGSPV